MLQGLSRMHGQLRAARTMMLVLAICLSLVLLPPIVAAQTAPISPGTVVEVANTGGQRLNLRAGPATTATVVTRLEPGTRLTVTGTVVAADGFRWLPVRDSAGQVGWVADLYVIVVSGPPPPTRTPAPTATPIPSAASPADAPNESETKGRPLTVEAKLKYPELDGREQEITVWVTRDGAPVPDVLVTLETRDGDDDEKFRELDPTNEEGRTRRTFDVRDEKGTVELQVEAVAPDGGEGFTTVSYFRR